MNSGSLGFILMPMLVKYFGKSNTLAMTVLFLFQLVASSNVETDCWQATFPQYLGASDADTEIYAMEFYYYNS